MAYDIKLDGGNKIVAEKMLKDIIMICDECDINYWLEQWTLFYKNIYQKYKNYENCHFIVYEKLTDQNYINLLLKKIDIKIKKNIIINSFKNFNKEKININFEKNIYENSKNIYKQFII